jgi:hypothetical protein
VTVQPRTRGKNGATATPHEGLSRWPVAVRPLRAWGEPGIMRWRSWRAWSATPLPPAVQRLLDGLWAGRGLARAVREHPMTESKLRPQSPAFALHIVLVIPVHLLYKTPARPWEPVSAVSSTPEYGSCAAHW